MLLEYTLVNPQEIDYRRATPDAYKAFKAGNVALLGYSESATRKPELFQGNIAELLLASPSTAIMHFDDPEPGEYARSKMMAVNYHDGHSEGHHRIIVQDPARPEEGQWELWVPPGSNNRTFYRREMGGTGEPYPFEEVPTNPAKIDHFYMHIGDPQEAFESFRAAGFEFSDEYLHFDFDDNGVYRQLNRLSNRNRDRWDPFAEA